MNILVDSVRISGFRGLANLEMTLPRVAVLIGTNNSGKTSVIKALQLALGDYSRSLTEEDFHIDSSDSISEFILIDVRIVPIGENGARKDKFDAEWVEEFEDLIQSEVSGNQFLAIRTQSVRDKVKGGFNTSRLWMAAWPDFEGWQSVKVPSKQKVNKRFDSMPFISIDAQRDIHQELREKSSFVGKVLSSIEYDDGDIASLEKMISEINEAAVAKSEPLVSLKKQLESLNDSFEGSGHADITPFPKKIRDLSKRFTVHYGEKESNSFSMEYHGMGTRSWASMLTVKAFTELAAKKHEDEFEPFFPIIAAEEPEAHLHPNAQRTLYQQLAESNGQVIVSSHSPYLAALADLRDIRSLIKMADNVVVRALIDGLDVKERQILQREVMRFRGEVLFSKAIILFEGVTEEQIVPAMFEHYFGFSPFTRGINCISVAGQNYAPFIKLACSLGIPVCVVSDNDGATKTNTQAQIKNIKRDTGLTLGNDIFDMFYLNDGNDIETELMNNLGLREEVVEALVLTETKGSENEQYVAAKKKSISALTDAELLENMAGAKASYAGFLADVICRNPNQKDQGALVPDAFKEAFTKIKGWLAI